MSEDGKSITNGLRELRQFYQQVALLLQHANGMMEAGGWTYISKHMSAIDTAAKLEDGDGWLPETVFCVYKNPDQPHILPFVSVIIDDTYGQPSAQIDEPLMTAGWVDFGVDRDAMKEWDKDPDAAYLHGWMNSRKSHPVRNDNGTFHEGDAREVWDDKLSKGIIVKTFGYLLVGVTDCNYLKNEIISRLLAAIAESS